MQPSHSEPIDKSTLRAYDSCAIELSNRYERGDRSAIHERFIQLFPTGARVLDVGCGSGADVSFLSKSGFIAEGIDASPKMLVEALRHHPELASNLRNLTCPSGLSSLTNGCFGGISAQSVLMHLNEAQLESSFREFHRLLAAEGVLYISLFDSRDDLDSAGRDCAGRRFYLYSDDQIQELLSSAGFAVRESAAVVSDALGRPGVRLREYVAAKPQQVDEHWGKDLKLP